MPEWTRTQVWRRKLLYPAHTLPTAAAPVVVAYALALRDGVASPGAAFLAFLAGWLIQVGGVLTDNYENLRTEPEDREHPELVRALRNGTLSMGQLQLAIAVAYAFALAAGLALVAHAGAGVLAIGLASVLASVAYSAGPFPLGRHALADPLFFAFFGVVSVAGAYYAQAAPAFAHPGWWVPQAFPLTAILLGIPLGALTTNILVIDDIRDREYDIVKGKRTIAVRFGIAASRAEFTGLLLLAYIAPLALWLGLGMGPAVLLPWLTLPFALSTLRDVRSRSRYDELLPTTPKAGRLLLAYSVLLAAGVALPALAASVA